MTKATKKEEANEFNVAGHSFVPKHKVMSEEEANKLMQKYKVTIQDLPKILRTDAAIQELDAKVGDVIEITRDSEIVGKAKYYRVVVNV